MRIRPRHRIAGLLVAGTLAVLPLAGCGGEGTSTRCSLSACTVTFQRGVDANLSILGAELRLVGAGDNQATVEVGGQQVQLQVDQAAQVGGFEVRLTQLTDQQAVVQVTQGGGDGGG